MRNLLLALGGVVLFLTIGFFVWESHGHTEEFLHPTTRYALWALALGAFSAVSLPLGSIAGFVFKPGAKTTASFTAFGAGALLAALSIELIAPTVMQIVGQVEGGVELDHDKQHAAYNLGALIVGCLLGGLLFYTLDELINSKGGFLRKASTIISFVKRKKENKPHDFIHEGVDVHNIKEVKEHSEENNGAPMAIWLGLLIDGIPESFVIGAGFLAILSLKLSQGLEPSFFEIVPYTLIAGLFLSNFPEAMSASIGMKKQGMKVGKILMLWSSLVVIVGVGAMVGYYVGSEIPHELEIGIEGLAAGAMLTMIAQTMIPEAVHIGGHKVVGLSTLFGYMSAVAFKLFE